MLNFDKTDLIEDSLIIQNEDGCITCIPKQDCTPTEQLLFDEFRIKFPDGKPIIPVEPQEPIPTNEEQIELLQQKLNNAKQISADNNQSFQELLELLIETGVI
jgi:hypothetical protein